MQMRQSRLQAFHQVAVSGGFSRAAAVLGLTQPAVSEQVRKLEQEYDVLLFRRGHKQIALTEAGEALLVLTRRLFGVGEQIDEYLSQTRAGAVGALRIVVDSAYHVTGILRRFRARYPKVHVELRTGNSGDVLSALRSYGADIGVVGSLSPGRDMDVYELGSSPVVAFGPRGAFGLDGRARGLKDLAQLPLVMRERGSKTRQKLEAAARAQGVRLIPAIEAEGREAVREIVASGAGIGFVSQTEFGFDKRIVQVPLAGVDLQMGETLICLGQRRDVRVIRAFTGIVGG
jgi:aminoethylphosphonate catabolism LysR family transcriptional regulator